MGSRGRSATNIRSQVVNELKNSDNIKQAILYGATSPFRSQYFVGDLENRIGRAYFDRDVEVTISEVNSIVNDLREYVESERDKRRK